MREIIMPKLGLSMETGTIGKWLKKEGERVEAGEILLEVESDKSTIEVEAFHSGTLLKILKREGDEVPVTAVIGYIGEPGEKLPAETAVPGRGPDQAPERLRVSPAAKRLAEENGLDVSLIRGTGPEGRIVLSDVERALAAGAVAGAAAADAASHGAPREKSRRPLTGTRKVIAERLTSAVQNVPHVLLTVVVDAEPLVRLKQALQAKAGTLTITDFIVKAAALVLREQPALNAALIDNQHIVYQDINIGLAADTEKGLVVPTIYSADALSVVEIARARTEVLERVRSSRHTREDISCGTFTVTNLGMFGIRTFTAIINPPQSAILIAGEIYKAPVVAGDRIEIGTLIEVSVAVDHRILDGADAARFLGRLREIMQKPAGMIPAELA